MRKVFLLTLFEKLFDKYEDKFLIKRVWEQVNPGVLQTGYIDWHKYPVHFLYGINFYFEFWKKNNKSCFT